MAVVGGPDSELTDIDKATGVGYLTKRSHMALEPSSEHNSSTVHTVNTQCVGTFRLDSQLDNARDHSVGIPSKTADAMARRCPKLMPCSTAEPQLQASHPPVKFVNGFQKRLGVYKTGSRETDMTSDSESDISSLEIDSNLSHSSDFSNNSSALKCSFLPQNDEHLDGCFTTENTSQSGADHDGVLVDNHHENTVHTPHVDETQIDKSFRQNNLNLKRLSRDDLLFPYSTNKQRADPISLRRSSMTSSAKKSPNSARKSQPLVIKIRRRTWTVSENAQCHHDSTPQNGDVKRARTSSAQQAEIIKPAFEHSSSNNQTKTVNEWHSIITGCLPVETAKVGKDFRPKHESNKKTPHLVSKKKHQQRKSRKIRGELIPHRKKTTSHERHHKTKRKKGKDTASKNHSKSKLSHPGKTLRLPSDPQKAVKVLERALESINAQIKQLKQETGNESRARSRRVLLSKKPSKERLHKAKKRHNSNKIAKKLNMLPPTLSLFRLSDSFPVVPSLIVRDGDLHPAYSASIDPGEPPVTNHPIWRWRIGQAPLPRPTAPADQVSDW